MTGKKDLIKKIEVKEPFKIKKGDAFTCIKDVVMNDRFIAYKKGGYYTSEFDDCITDERHDKEHFWLDKREFEEHFKYFEYGLSAEVLSKSNDNVNHPKHCTSHPSGVDCIDKNVQAFKNIANELCDLYEKKNKAYGNSFGDTYKKLGIISAVTRISDKYNRLCNLATNPNIDNLGESVEDTLKDLAAYSIMTLMEIHKENDL
jgi:hypothetical protein